MGRGGLFLGLLVLESGPREQNAAGGHVKTHQLEGLCFLGEGLDEGRMGSLFEDLAKTRRLDRQRELGRLPLLGVGLSPVLARVRVALSHLQGRGTGTLYSNSLSLRVPLKPGLKETLRSRSMMRMFAKPNRSSRLRSAE